jgi:hypothetical protein
VFVSFTLMVPLVPPSPKERVAHPYCLSNHSKNVCPFPTGRNRATNPTGLSGCCFRCAPTEAGDKGNNYFSSGQIPKRKTFSLFFLSYPLPAEAGCKDTTCFPSFPTLKAKIFFAFCVSRSLGHFRSEAGCKGKKPFSENK